MAQNSLKSSKGRNASNKNYGLITAGLVAAITVIALCGSIFAYCVHLVNSQDGIYEGVSIGGVDVSGLSRHEAASRLEEQMDAVNDNLTFNVVSGEYCRTVEPSELGLTYDTGSAAAKAYNYGRGGSFFDSVRSVYSAKTKGYDIPFDYSYDDEKIAALSLEIARDITAMPSDTTFEVKDDSVVVTLGSGGIAVSSGDVRTLLQQRLNASGGDVIIGEDTDNKASVDLDKIKREVDREAEDAYLDDSDPEDPKIIPEKNGMVFDIDKARAILDGEGEGDGKNIYTIPIEIIEPEVKSEDIVFYTYNDLLSTATTNLNPGLENRTSNIKLACSKINGLILNPGEEFSFNTIVGKRTYEAGFKDAAIYLAGEIADGVGGGICQVSSTVYMSAVSADLDITQRKNHRYTVTYTKLGQDATVSYDVGVDFKFKNDRDTAIKIVIVQESDYVKCDIYGTFEPGEENKKVTMESKTIKSEPFNTVYVVDDSIPVNTQKLKNGGYTGYTVETYRVVTQDGKEVSRTLESKSVYTKLDKTYLINSKNAVKNDSGATTYSEYVEPTTPPDPIIDPWWNDDPDDTGDGGEDEGGTLPFWLG